MNNQQIKELAARLEAADKLSSKDFLRLRHDLERYARLDLYGAARICRDHLRDKSALRLPSIIEAADKIQRRFEDRMHEHRRAVDLQGERDRQLRQPEDGKGYVGPIVGNTPKCVIQLDRETNDFIIHAKQSLSTERSPETYSSDVSIHYPFKAVGGVGLVQDMAAKQLSTGLQMEHGAERTAHQKDNVSVEMER